MEQKTIAVLTSGGDAPGMNAAVRAVVRTAIANDMRVLGVRRGYDGLIHGDMIPMNLRSVSDIIQNGGAALFTARSPAFMTEEGQKQAVDTCKKFDISGVVVIGGDGSFRGAKALCEKGIPCVAIPGTIDNDIACTEYTIGFDTAMNTAVEMVDRLRDTTESHNRCSVVEVMGRRCGDIALETGIAVGATCILVPEIAYDFERDILNRMEFTSKTGKHHFIVVVAEGVGHVSDIAKQIEAHTGIETRPTVLGHVQRGGSPTLRDRVAASQMGYHAVKLLHEGRSGRVVIMKDNKIADLDMAQALEMKRPFDDELYRIAMTISI